MKNWLNGSLVSESPTVLPVSDRGFLLSDGLFETLRVLDGEILHIPAHLQRLRHGLSVLKLDLKMSDSELEAGLSEVVSANHLARGSLRLTVTRGSGPRGLLPPEEPVPTVLITCAASGATTELPPVRLATSPYRRNEGSPLSKVKALGYLDNILALQKARQDGFDDAILLNNAGRVTCTSSANIFLLLKSGWVTPAISDGVLPGITRRQVLDHAARNSFPVEERSIAEGELHQAEAAFITNSLIHIRPVASINGRALGREPDDLFLAVDRF